jgi:hypothetical protein
MLVPFRTFALFGLAFGMLAAGYLFAPAPGASRPLVVQPIAKVAPVSSTPAPTLVMSRPPVPLVPKPHDTYFQQPSAEPAAATTPAADATAQAAAAPDDNVDPKRAIELDGYKKVHAVVKGSDGNWHARALRGSTEIAVRVDASGNVSAE